MGGRAAQTTWGPSWEEGRPALPGSTTGKFALVWEPIFITAKSWGEAAEGVFPVTASSTRWNWEAIHQAASEHLAGSGCHLPAVRSGDDRPRGVLGAAGGTHSPKAWRPAPPPCPVQRSLGKGRRGRGSRSVILTEMGHWAPPFARRSQDCRLTRPAAVPRSLLPAPHTDSESAGRRARKGRSLLAKSQEPRRARWLARCPPLPRKPVPNQLAGN